MYLIHHGIKGQRWGIKYGPPYPIDREKPLTIKKGSKFAHVTSTKKMKLDSRGVYLYDPNDGHDSDVYIGGHALGLKIKNMFKKVYEVRFENVEDLKMPSHKEKIDAFVKTLSDKTQSKLESGQTLEEYLDYYAYVTRYRISSMMFQNPSGYANNEELYVSMLEDGRKWVEKRDKEAGYSLFMSNFAIEKDMRNATENFINRLKRNGYNAIIDDNDVKRYNDAHAPIYVFNGSKSLSIDKSKPLKMRDIMEAGDRLKNKLGRQPDYT